jgi:opacity protein-like surface antigen
VEKILFSSLTKQNYIRSYTMKKLLFILVAILVFVGSWALGQEAVPGPAAASKGVLFSFSGLSELGAGKYEGGFGLKLYLSDYMAVRGMVQFGLSSTTTPANPSAGGIGADGSSSDNLFGVGGAIELHLTKNRISPYVGAGVMFSTRSTESKPTAYASTGGTIHQTTTKNADGYTQIKIGVLAGVEYFITDGVSLSAEYQLGFISTSYKDEEVTTTGSPTVTTKGGSNTSIGISNSGLLTLAVYF